MQELKARLQNLRAERRDLYKRDYDDKTKRFRSSGSAVEVDKITRQMDNTEININQEFWRKFGSTARNMRKAMEILKGQYNK